MSQAEKRLVGAALRDPTVYGRVQVQHEQFSDLAMRAIWKAMGALADQGLEIDELSLADILSAKVLLAVGGPSGLSKLSTTTTANVTHYADLVRGEYLAKSVRAKASEILEQPEGALGADLLTMLSTSENALRCSLTASRRTLGAVVAEEVTRALSSSGAPLGLPTHLGIDRWIPGGLPRGKVTTLFADTGSYKTTAVNQLMFGNAELGYQGLLVPLEDSDELTAHRWMSRKSGVHYGRIAGGICNDAERNQLEKLNSGDWACLDNIRSCDGVDPNIDNIIREVAAAKANGGLDFVVLDYMQLLEGRGKTRDIITDAMKKAANAAKRYNVVWINLSQKNDKSLDRKDPRPHLGDLFGSASMKQMSKTVLALFRPHEHWPNPAANHPLHGMYHKMIERMPSGKEIYENTLELWMCKNVLGKKRSMQLLVAKPEQGILDPMTATGWL